MNEAHIHLAINHFPVILPVAGLLLMVAGFIFRSEIMKRAAFSLFIAGALLAFPASASGEGAEEIVENLQGVEEKFIEAHEEKAETFAILSYILGGLSLIGIWASYKQKPFSKIISAAVTLFAAVVLYFGMMTANSGGEIRHQEIRDGFETPAAGEDEEEEHTSTQPHLSGTRKIYT
jgi:uncharacterized membrane protein